MTNRHPLTATYVPFDIEYGALNKKARHQVHCSSKRKRQPVGCLFAYNKTYASYVFTPKESNTHPLACFRLRNSLAWIICANRLPMAVASPGPA